MRRAAPTRRCSIRPRRCRRFGRASTSTPTSRRATCQMTSRDRRRARRRSTRSTTPRSLGSPRATGPPTEAAALTRARGLLAQPARPELALHPPAQLRRELGQPDRRRTTATWSPDFQDGYQEGTGWQYLWSEPQDVAGLAEAIGGRDATLSRLDRLLHDAARRARQSRSSRPPSRARAFSASTTSATSTRPRTSRTCGPPWYYDWLGEPWKAQKVARAEMGVYNTTPDGLPGNDDARHDVGLVRACRTRALPRDPRRARLGSSRARPLAAPPCAPAAARSRSTRRARPSRSRMSTAATLDGKDLDRSWLTNCELNAGGALAESLAAAPNRAWASSGEAAPPSISDAQSRGPLTACS